jgi:hypothetical protein
MTPYDEIAEWYHAWVGGDRMADDPFLPAVEALIGDVAHLRICDLACGQGRVARDLADLGVDLSVRLLEIARCYEQFEPRAASTIALPTRTLHGIPGAYLDDIVCFQTLMDIPMSSRRSRVSRAPSGRAAGSSSTRVTTRRCRKRRPPRWGWTRWSACNWR